MIEIPETIALSKQIKQKFIGKTINRVVADTAHHSYAWYTNDDPDSYPDMICGKTIIDAEAYGGKLHVNLTDKFGLMFCDGASLRYIEKEKKLPKRHQLLIEFDDGTYLVGTIRMYGGLYAYQETLDVGYNLIARSTRSVFSDEFNSDYLMKMSDKLDVKKTSVKALLSKEQRIPGFGNGVLQDVLFDASIKPKRKVSTLSEEDFQQLVNSIKEVLTLMADSGGRDVEKDLYGNPGGYKTIMSKNTYKSPCPRCGDGIIKESFLGGSVYYCGNCQE
ncbi:MAG: hypothetical protein MI740_18295 [Halanaerobiales bacterium]|nr:hypothetical protein [Halanaerobiales bacterium]